MKINTAWEVKEGEKNKNRRKISETKERGQKINEKKNRENNAEGN